MRGVIVVVLSLALSGCGAVAGSQISNMDTAQISHVSDEAVCHPLASGAVVERERQRRGLADCSPEHVQCKNLGYSSGSPEYIQCRQMFMQQALALEQARQNALNNFNSSWQKAYGPRPTSHTTCRPNVAGSVDCNTRY